ncbi:FMN reductase [Cupriavidus neocaledonicus]|uniref:FMN reductase n=1 Tax=Cupriavidus neocaledonicus TaxID=1040979 RepID=A0A375H7G9_9BURK|nr:FMN reductase [Cupriavidus neocaledonicus]SOZ34819.1 FMN reductase [Cupriavidus neocaledonicus]SPD46816.1 FMN reductase (NADPH) [Cupriavidus neocaledonicus]
MSKPLKLVAVNGSTQQPSRTLALVEALIAELDARLHVDAHVINLAEIARPLGGALWRTELPTAIEAQLQAIESADLVIAASPVYRGAYPGHFKHLFDLIGQDALADKPVLLAATGGSERHALVLEHQLRPLFGFLQALTLPIGVYATPADFESYTVQSPALRERIQLAADRAAPLFAAHRRVALKAA